MVAIMVVVGIHLSTSMSIIVTLSTITITTKEIPQTVLITTSIKGISILLVKVAHAHRHHKLAVDQELQLPTEHRLNLQHHQDEPKVAPQHLIELHHLTKPLHRIEPHHHLTELQHRHLADHQHHKQGRHHRAGLLLRRDHLHHHAHQAPVVHVEVAEEEVEDDKFFIQTNPIKKEAVQYE